MRWEPLWLLGEDVGDFLCSEVLSIVFTTNLVQRNLTRMSLDIKSLPTNSILLFRRLTTTTDDFCLGISAERNLTQIAAPLSTESGQQNYSIINLFFYRQRGHGILSRTCNNTCEEEAEFEATLVSSLRVSLSET